MNQLRLPVLATTFAVVAIMTGCAAPYVPAPNEVMVPVRFMGMGTPRLCKDGTIYSLTGDAAGVLKVPAGQRIAIGTYMYFDHYTVNYTCMPWVSFVPQDKQAYVANSGLNPGQRCFVEVVREDASKESGVVLEPSTGSANCRKPSP